MRKYFMTTGISSMSRSISSPHILLTAAAVLLLISCIDRPAGAVSRALLVGVSEYPSLDEDSQLRGPVNDVQLMREVLLRRGFDADRIRTLADGVKGAALPTRAAILSALEVLVAEASEGDLIYLHLSGHGSRQSQGRNDEDHEPDGLDEIFLPRPIAGSVSRSSSGTQADARRRRSSRATDWTPLSLARAEGSTP